MTEGTKLIGTTNDDMVEFLQYIRAFGGECVCTDYDQKIVEVIRGTNEEKSLFNIDGVLGSVNVSGTRTSETEQTGRSELLQRDEGNLLQLGYESDLRTS